MQKWEYLVMENRHYTASILESSLNSYGNMGYEVCGISETGIILKRPVIEKPTCSPFMPANNVSNRLPAAKCGICGDPNCPEPNQKH